MSTAIRTSRPASPADVVALQYTVPARLVTIPLAILAGVVLVMTAVTLIVVLSGGRAAAVGGNGAVIWSLFGFIVAVGVQAVAVSFPLALAFGSTRRTFTVGTLATIGAEAVLLTVASLVLLGLEVLTGGWFVGARVLADSTLGGGDPFVLTAVMFLATLSALAVGGLFGAAWVRFGASGPLLLGAAIAAALVLVLLALAPQLVAVAAVFEPWWLAVAAGVVVAVATAGQYGMLRRASVR